MPPSTRKNEGRLSSIDEPLQNDANRRQIRQQLEKLLADHLFQSNTRYGSMLQFVVEHALEEKHDHLKERTIGSEVFQRDPDYDTNSDPVVRVTASELRKRLAQYYVDPRHAAELHIALPAGAYVPTFRFPVPFPTATRRNVALRLWPFYLLVVATFIAGLSVQFKPASANTARDLFWRPILNSTGEVVFCVAPPNRVNSSNSNQDTEISIAAAHALRDNSVSLADLIAFSKISEYLTLHGKQYEIRTASAVNLSDLRGRPAILIGAFNNDWTLRLLKELRFSFEIDQSGQNYSIKDNQNGERQWNVDVSLPYNKLAEDYAIISRVKNVTTEQLLVSVAGITQIGTIAAGEFLADEANLQGLLRESPEFRHCENLQIVLATKIINGCSGPTRIVAKAIW